MLTAFMHVASFIGSAGLYLPVLAVLLWCVHPRWAARALVLLAVSAALNTLLKLTFGEPRPFWTDPTIIGHEPRSSFGMPSGHAQNAVVTWGFVALTVGRRWAWAGGVALIALIGISRIALGVHSAAQVVAGWATGAVLLVLMTRLEPVVRPWWRERGLAARAAISLAVTAGFLLPTIAAIGTYAGWAFPGAWAAQITAAGGAVEPVSGVTGALATGSLFGVLLGVSVLDRRGRFDPGGSWPRRLARIPIGAAGAGVIGAAGLLADEHVAGAFVAQTLLGVWVIAGAPEVFVRLGLASRTGDPPDLTRPGEKAVAGRP